MIEADKLKVFMTEGKVFISVEEAGEILAQPGLEPDEAIDLASQILDSALCLKRKIVRLAEEQQEPAA